VVIFHPLKEILLRIFFSDQTLCCGIFPTWSSTLMMGLFPLGGNGSSHRVRALIRNGHIQSVAGWHPHFRPLF